MAIKKIEALADAIGRLNKVHEPSSDAYQLRNPGLFRAYTYKHLAETDEKGRRIFTSLIGGYRFLVQDLTWKCSGETRAKGEAGKLKPTSTLQDLLRAFRLTAAGDIFELVDFLQQALKDSEIAATTTLSYFLENTNVQ